MPIEKINYRQFYFGTGAEYFIINKFYMMGYEAHKLNPDIGYDMLITNKAKSKFFDAEYKEIYIQVKSAICFNERASFWIDKVEFDHYLTDTNCIVVFLFYIPQFYPDPRSFYYDRSGDSWEMQLEADGRENFIERYHTMTPERKEDILQFCEFNCHYFWLNNNHLSYLINNSLVSDDVSKDGKKYKVININYNKESSAIYLVPKADYQCKRKNTAYLLVPEVRNVYYLMNDCWCKEDVNNGKLFYIDS